MSSGRIAILSRGLWRLRDEVAELTGMQPVRATALACPPVDAFAGWGHKPTAARARRMAERHARPYLAIEDGPLRSVKPGASEPPLALILDRSGIYYDSRAPSDLTDLIGANDWFTAEERARAARASSQLRRLRLSKYNSGPELSAAQMGLGSAGRPRILVVDQVRGDASIAGAGADAARFAAMLQAAMNENPEAEIVVKTHPAAAAGGQSGHFAGINSGERITFLSRSVNPWSLLDLVDKVYTVSSGLGFEAAVAGKAIVCFGAPFYSGWGFTDDRHPAAPRPGSADALKAFAAFYLRYTRYFDAYSRRQTSFEEAAEQLAWLRDRFMEQSRRSVCLNVSWWKRPTFNRLLDGPSGPPLYRRSVSASVEAAQADGGQVVAWASRAGEGLVHACVAAGVPLIRVEDGFIRSAGLGAAFTPAQSLALDEHGIYYDPRQASDLERLLQEGDLPEPLLERARRLRDALIATRTTKYNVPVEALNLPRREGRKTILVPGQVEDDASVRLGSPVVRDNLALLRAVRDRHPDATIVYKPHPDVEAGLRAGRVAEADAKGLVDEVVQRAPILQLIEACDHVETMTSLAGFEALIRGKPVTTHGQPFYAGWGLTEDLFPPPRRTRRASIDELVAAALIQYARYVDPVTGLRCGPEVLVGRLAAVRNQPNRLGSDLLRMVKLLVGRTRYVVVRAR